MDVARCTLDNRNYDIPTFEALGLETVARYRRYLVCSECAGPGFYRKESRSGQAACFGARPHTPHCSMAAVEPRRGGGLGPGQDQAINLGERIEVDFDYGAHPIVNPDPAEPRDPRGLGGRYVGNGATRSAVMHRRPSTLLRNLIHSEDFRNSQQLIAIPQGEYRVCDFFVPFSEINEESEGEFRGYWGLITDAGLSSEEPRSLWLNSGGRDDVSMVVNHELSHDFMERFPYNDLEDFAGAYALIFGEIRISRYGKKFIRATNISQITISYP